MKERITQSKWFNYIVETVTLAFILGLLGGVIVGLLRDWKYTSKGLYFITLDAINLSINEGILIAFLFLLLYLIVFLVLRSVFLATKKSSVVSSAILLIPVFLFIGYKINKAYITGVFELRAFMLNLAIGIGFILLWLLVSIGLYLWTKSRILNTSNINIKGLSLLIGIILVCNISMFLFHRLHKIDSPNVIILLVDCLRADHLSSYGYDRNTTPNIDRFSKDSVLFTQAISQSTFTKISIASLFTSRYPYQHGVYQGSLKDTENNISSDVLSEKEKTLAETLLENEFLTSALVFNPHLKPYTGFAQGFVEYDEPAGSIEDINNEFINWIDEIGERHPFFTYIHYLDLHDPYRPKPPYDTMYGRYSDLYSRIGLEYSDIGKENWRSFLRENGMGKLEERDVDQLKAYYDGQLTYIDTQIGLLLEELKKLGLYDNTLIILTADHGDGFMEHGFISHSFTPYEELIRVPLIIKFPNSLNGGKVVKRQVRLIDVMPTILDFLNIRTDNKLSGFSLMNYIYTNKNKDRKIAFPKYAYSEIATELSIRTEGYKYIHFEDKKRELYDLRVDPKEENNVTDSRPDEAEKFRKMALGVVAKRKEKDVGKAVLDKETIEELKTLGYIQ